MATTPAPQTEVSVPKYTQAWIANIIAEEEGTRDFLGRHVLTAETLKLGGETLKMHGQLTDLKTDILALEKKTNGRM